MYKHPPFISFIAAFAIISILSSGAAANSSQVTIPSTLLSLYANSDAIFAAKYDRTEKGEARRQDGEYSVVELNKYFEVLSTLKGEPLTTIVLTGETYRNNETGNASDRQEILDTELKSGDTVLLFLRKIGDSGRVELTDNSEGLKKLSRYEVDVYKKRIAELDEIFAEKEIKSEEIVDWLIRCAEQPSTRWEGTFELVKSFERLDWQEKQSGKTTDRVGIVKAAARKSNAANRADILGDITLIARSVNSDQKKALANILFAHSYQYSGDDQSGDSLFVRGDRELIDLAKRWRDPRLAVFLLNELKFGSASSYRTVENMRMLSDVLNDPTAKLLADRLNTIPVDGPGRGEQAVTGQKAGSDAETTRIGLIVKFIKHAEELIAKQRSQPAKAN